METAKTFKSELQVSWWRKFLSFGRLFLPSILFLTCKNSSPLKDEYTTGFFGYKKIDTLRQFDYFAWFCQKYIYLSILTWFNCFYWKFGCKLRWLRWWWERMVINYLKCHLLNSLFPPASCLWHHKVFRKCKCGML